MTISQQSTKRRPIKPLPIRVINKIAAGEVIERPASVVKELVENSVDAGATKVDIIIEKSGTQLIQIVDNGCGIDADQIEIAFSRHATSKISAFDDLDRLNSYGFRGEALPSIASVSRLRMVSRTVEAESATEIIYEGGVLQSSGPASAPFGTTVEIEQLFFNTPARRKFMKTESTEARHIARVATAFAIGSPGVGVSLVMNDREVFSILANSTLEERVVQLLGRDSRFVTIESADEPFHIRGCVGIPELAQHNRHGQYLFINNRYIQSPTLSHAFAAGYGELLPRGRYPVGALLITVDPTQVDVNVHPAKTEVRLSHEREAHHAVSQAIKQTIQQEKVIPDFRSPDSPANPLQAGSLLTIRDKNQSGALPGVRHKPSDSTDLLKELYRHRPFKSETPMTGGVLQVDTSTGEVVSELMAERVETVSSDDGIRLLGRFHDLYIFTQIGDHVYVIDQHTAHERILYEETLAALQQRKGHGQNLLFPTQVELTPEQLQTFEESQELFSKSGFSVSPFGGRTVNIDAVPVVLAAKPPAKIFLAIIDDLQSLRKAGHDLTKAMAQTIACRSAVMAGDRLSDTEALHLVKRLLQCQEKYSCPHGRPTFVRISRADLDRQFGRA